MDLGLYKLKYPARRVLQSMLPAFRNVAPDVISWCIIPAGIATAVAYWFADACPALLLAGALLIGVRMVLATLDGLVAETYHRHSRLGEIVNRLPAELADVMLLAALTLSSPSRHLPGALALSTAWLTTYSGLIGLIIGRPIQSVGPIGQTDRLAALIAFSIAGFFAALIGHPFDELKWFLTWCAIGGCLTVALRLWRTMKRDRWP
jgi:phosphatidylglycerophosphate synthase